MPGHSTLRLPAEWFLFFLCFTSFAQAVYYIDDANNTVQFSSLSWKREVIGDNDCTCVDDNRVWGHTLTHNARPGCAGGNGCTVTIPFHGSGITLYNVVRSSIRIDITVDGGSPSTYYSNGSGCLDTGNANLHGCYNISIYNVQQLAYGNHVALMELPTHDDDFFFDYAVVNDTVYAPPSSTPTSTLSPTASSHKLVGAAVGGAIGGSVVIMAIVFTILYYRRRRHRQEVIHDETKGSGARNPMGNSALLPTVTYAMPITSTSAGSAPDFRGRPASGVTPIINESSRTEVSPSASSTLNSPTLDQRLSRGQVELIQNMHNLNTPAPAIAALLDGMLRAGESSPTPPLPSIPLTPSGPSIPRGPPTDTNPGGSWSPPTYKSIDGL